MSAEQMAVKLSRFASTYGGRLVELGAVLHEGATVWFPKFEGLDDKAHRAAIKYLTSELK